MFSYIQWCWVPHDPLFSRFRPLMFTFVVVAFYHPEKTSWCFLYAQRQSRHYGIFWKPDIVIHACNGSTQEAETWRLLPVDGQSNPDRVWGRAPGQPGLHRGMKERGGKAGLLRIITACELWAVSWLMAEFHKPWQSELDFQNAWKDGRKDWLHRTPCTVTGVTIRNIILLETHFRWPIAQQFI